MISNYLLIAIRNFKRQKLFALLNMFGLALGLASAILIFLYINDELQYDTMQPYYNDTYRIGALFKNKDGQTFENTVSPGRWLKQVKDTRPEIIAATRVDYIGYPTSLQHKAKDKIILTEEIKWVEPGFDKIIAFDLLHGNLEKMFDKQNTMVVSEAGARKLFGDEDPIGQIISVKHNWATQGREIDVEITGVFRDFPSNSHFKALYILNVNALRAVNTNFDTYMEGGNFRDNIEFFENYIVVKPGTDLKPIEATLKNLANELAQSDSGFAARGWTLSAFLTRLPDLHFDQKNIWEYSNSPQGDKKYLAIFGSVAILILLIACINYMNLATARSARRAKEVGLRKSLGSRRSEIAKQFFYESALMTFGALLLSLLLVIIFLQPFNQLAHKTFTLASLLDPYMLAAVLGIVILMAIISGSYPAIYLSSFNPAEVLKGQVVRGAGAELFRKSLVTIQFTVSLVLIISTAIIIRQMQYMQETTLNQQGSQLLSIRYGGTAPQEKFGAFKQAVLQDPDIEHVTMANHLPRLDYFGWIGANVKFPEIEDKDMQWSQLNVEFDFAKTYQLEFIAGRDFDPSSVADSASMILNEAAVKALNQPIDKILGTSVIDRNDRDRAFKVIGVVKDFPYRSMHQTIEPLLLNPRLHQIDKIAYIKLPAGKFQEKIASIEKKWKEVMPNVGFDYWFVNDEFNRMYTAENRISSLAKTFAILAIIITSLGIFGLASYTAEQKTKEVGIRKVLGASEKQVVGMFVWLFIKIFLIACAIALPIAYFLSENWLKTFVYRAPFSVLIFGVSLLGLLVITLVTVSYETWKAAKANPVVSLRSE
jgi:putative ABC transport system permease protein